MSTTGLGIALGVLGSIAINTGNNLQCLGMNQLEASEREKKAIENLNEEEKVDDDCEHGVIQEKLTKDCDAEDLEPIDACQSKIWILGTVIFVSGSLLNFTAFAFAPQSILASLEGIQFVTNVAFGKCVQKKKISRSMYAGTLVIICGVVLTVLSASVVGTLDATFSDLLGLWMEWVWLLYLALTVMLGVVLQAMHQVYLKAKAEGNPLPYTEYVLPVTYATFSALFGTLSVVFAKILSEILTMRFEGTPIFYGKYCWFTYVTLMGWLALVGVWLYRMNEALSLYDPLFIIPLLQMNFILFAIISGGIYFKEFNQFKTVNWIGFILGVLLLFIGIVLLSPSNKPPQIYPGDEEDSIEDSVVEVLDGNIDEVDYRSPSVPRTQGLHRGSRSPSVTNSIYTPRSPRTPRTPRRRTPSSEECTPNPANTLPFYTLIPTSLRLQRRESHEETSLFGKMKQVQTLSQVVANLKDRVSPNKRRASSVNVISPEVRLAALLQPNEEPRRRTNSLNRISSPIPIDSEPITPMLKISEILPSSALIAGDNSTDVSPKEDLPMHISSTPASGSQKDLDLSSEEETSYHRNSPPPEEKLQQISKSIDPNKTTVL